MRILVVCALFFTVVAVHAGETSLPAPQKSGGMPLFQAIDQRGSALGAQFPSGAVSNEALSTILWSATGQNRDGSRWTVPMGLGKPPYCIIYYLNAQGVYRYDWKANTLVEVKKGDARAAIASQAFGKTAPGMLIIAANSKALSSLPNEQFQKEFALVLAGAMSQNIYLAAEGVNVGARLVYSIERDAAAEWLGLEKAGDALFAIYLGGK